MGYLAAPVGFITIFLLTVAAGGAVFATVSGSPSVPTPRRARVVFALGWLLFAAAQVMGLALESPPYGALLGARMAAVAMIAVVAAVSHVRARLRGFPRLALALGLFAASEVVTATLDSGSRGPAWFLAQVLAVAGGLALGWWLSGAFDVSIQFRTVTAFVSLLIVVVVLISSAMTQVFTAKIRDDALDRAATEARSLHNSLTAGSSEASARAAILAQLPSVPALVASRDARLPDVAKGFQAPGGLFESSDFIAFLAPGGGLLAVSAKGPGDTATLDALDVASLPGTSVVQRALNAQQNGGIDLVGGKMVLIGAAPMYRPDSPKQLIGAVSVGKVLNRAYLESLPRNTSQELSLITADNVVASTLRGQPSVADVAPAGVRGRVFSGKGSFSVEGTIAGGDYFSGFMPLERAGDSGRRIGALVVHQPSQGVVVDQQHVGWLLLRLALSATLVAVLLSYLVGARIARPIATLTQAAERVRLGDLTTRVAVEGSGEIGVLGSAFNQMTEAIDGLTAAFRDAAEEEFLLRSRLETILQSMTDGVVAVDTDGTIVAFNREAERMVGIKADQAVGRQADDVLVVEDPSGARIPLLSLPFEGVRRDSVRGVIASLAPSGPAGRSTVAERSTDASSTRTPVVITSATVSDESGNEMGLVAVVRDLTPEIEVERMKTEFLSNVSHELRTPLTPIKGYANLMIRREVPRTQAVGFLERIVESTDRLERIVGMLVDFSAMEAGRLVAKAVPVDLGSVVDQLVTRWGTVSPRHTFERKGFAGFPLLHLDQRLVPRAIDELIDNAVKFSPEGGRVLVEAALVAAVSDRKVTGAGSHLVRITVSDEGIGIARERLATLAGGFVQIDASETREYGGLGLGLAYVRRIAESHGGHLEEPSSMPGKGSSFTIVLPARPVDPSRPAAPALDGAGLPQDLPPRTPAGPPVPPALPRGPGSPGPATVEPQSPPSSAPQPPAPAAGEGAEGADGAARRPGAEARRPGAAPPAPTARAEAAAATTKRSAAPAGNGTKKATSPVESSTRARQGIPRRPRAPRSAATPPQVAPGADVPPAPARKRSVRKLGKGRSAQ